MRERRCLATGTVGPAEEMIRFVLDPGGRVVPDLTASLPGRGAWVRAERPALERAVGRKLFGRSFKAPASAAPELADEVERLLARRCCELLGLARRAGQAVAGFVKVEAWARAGKAGLLLTAVEGAEDGRRRLYGLAGDAPRIEILRGAELSLAFGRENVVHAALMPGRLADRLLVETRRLAGFRGPPIAARKGDHAGHPHGDQGRPASPPDQDERYGPNRETQGK